jgi:putative spermidine/putrescine transport system ATP-binding protein
MNTGAHIIPSRGSALELRNLSKTYGTIAAVRNISLRVEAGEFVALLGPSGSGKTTTLMMVAGFAVPDSGQVLLNGIEITALPPHKRNLGMVYQNYALFPHLTIERNVAFPLEMRGVARDEMSRRVGQALERVHLAEMKSRYPRQLSGGQQQRVALARALVFEPPVLLMDEPLGALDRRLRVEMQREIKSIQRELVITSVYVTHDQEEALGMADHVVVLHDGRVEQAASPTDLYDRPANAFVAEFIGAANLLSARVCEAGGPRTMLTEGGLRLLVADGARLTPNTRVTAIIRPERIAIACAYRSDAGAVPARVAETSFSGGQWRYRVQLFTGEHMLVVQNNVGTPPFAVGTAVSLSWKPEDVWIIPGRD